MNILATGAKGMVGTALVANLNSIKENKNRTRPDIQIDEIYEYDIDFAIEKLDKVCFLSWRGLTRRACFRLWIQQLR